MPNSSTWRVSRRCLPTAPCFFACSCAMRVSSAFNSLEYFSVTSITCSKRADESSKRAACQPSLCVGSLHHVSTAGSPAHVCSSDICCVLTLVREKRPPIVDLRMLGCRWDSRCDVVVMRSAAVCRVCASCSTTASNEQERREERRRVAMDGGVEGMSEYNASSERRSEARRRSLLCLAPPFHSPKSTHFAHTKSTATAGFRIRRHAGRNGSIPRAKAPIR